MNKSNRLLNGIKLGLLALGITMSPLTLAACYSGCSSGSSSSSSNQPSTGRGVTNLTKTNKTALERSYRIDDAYRKLSHIDKVVYIYENILGHSYKDTETGVYVVNFGAFLLSSDSILLRTKKTLEGMIEDGAGGRAAVNELKRINQELKNRADARANNANSNSGNSNGTTSTSEFGMRMSLDGDGGMTTVDPISDPSRFEKDIPPPIKSVIPELTYTPLLTPYLNADPKLAREKAAKLIADAEAKGDDAAILRDKAAKQRINAKSIDNPNHKAIAEDIANGMDEAAKALDKEATDLYRSADDHEQSAKRWEKRAADKQQKSEARARSRKASVIQTQDGTFIIPNYTPRF